MAKIDAEKGKRELIMSAALELFAQRGFHGAPTSAIARNAGIGVGTIYRYFKDKDTLIHELFQELHQRYQQQVLAGHDPDASLSRRFHQVFGDLLRMFIKHPAEFRFMELYYYSPYATSATSRLPRDDGIIYDILREIREQGISKDVPMKVLEAMAWGPVVALAKEHSNRNLVVTEEIISLTIQAAWDALRHHEKQ